MPGTEPAGARAGHGSGWRPPLRDLLLVAAAVGVLLLSPAVETLGQASLPVQADRAARQLDARALDAVARLVAF